MNRRLLFTLLSAIGLPPAVTHVQAAGDPPPVEPLRLSDVDWKARLTPAQYNGVADAEKLAKANDVVLPELPEFAYLFFANGDDVASI